MENKPIDITKEIKRAHRKAKVEAFVNSAKDIWDNNKQYLVVIVPAVGYAIGKGIKAVSQHHNLKLEEKTKDCRCYDTSLGHYWELKRKLTNEEWVKIDRRKKNGERLADILDELKVLK